MNISILWDIIVDKKEILRTVFNTGIYCSGDKVSTVYSISWQWNTKPFFEHNEVNRKGRIVPFVRKFRFRHY
jgi:hypothetical protein